MNSSMEKLKTWLKAENITQGDFAKAAKIKRPRLSILMSGGGMATAQNLANIIAASDGGLRCEELLPEPEAGVVPVKE